MILRSVQPNTHTVNLLRAYLPSAQYGFRDEGCGL